MYTHDVDVSLSGCLTFIFLPEGSTRNPRRQIRSGDNNKHLTDLQLNVYVDATCGGTFARTRVISGVTAYSWPSGCVSGGLNSFYYHVVTRWFQSSHLRYMLMVSKIISTLITETLGTHGNDQVWKYITALYAAATTRQPLSYKMCPETQMLSKWGVIVTNGVAVLLSLCPHRLIRGPPSATLITTSNSARWNVYLLRQESAKVFTLRSLYVSQWHMKVLKLKEAAGHWRGGWRGVRLQDQHVL